MITPFASPQDATERLANANYIATDALATTVFLAQKLGKPILAEGPAGVGKTELAKAIARALDAKLIRLQCYEGLDESKTLYEWKYPKQLLYTQMLRDRIHSIIADTDSLDHAVDRISAHEDVFFSERFLEPRPILQAVRSTEPAVLLIDEVDRAEDELEAFFLEVLAEFQVTVPELGTITAVHPPLVVLTSNSVRELSDALRRRCLYLPMDFPPPAVEAQIIALKVPGIGDALAAKVTHFVAKLRALDLKKAPSVSESIDWAGCLLALGASDLEPAQVSETLTVLLKYRGDVITASDAIDSLLGSARS